MVQQDADQYVEPRRGSILDKNGDVFATSIHVDTVVVNPKDIDKTKENTGIIAQKLESILGISRDVILDKLNKNNSYQILKRKVDSETANKVKAFVKQNKVKGIYLIDDSKRFYPEKNHAAHVIGFTSQDGRGLQGIEKSMEKYLKGMPGKIRGEADAGGRAVPFNPDDNIEVQDGFNVVLTIDKNVQDIADNVLEDTIQQNNVTGGAIAIVMDPRNGDILAMVSKPDFDLNEPYKAPNLPGVDPGSWKGYTQDEVDLLNKSVWRNKAISDTYEPGSAFKAITAAAALDEGVIKPEDIIEDSPVRVANWTFGSTSPNYKYEGKITFRQGVYKSSNPVFVRVSQKVGIKTFYEYVKAFGFFDKTGIDLPGEQKSLFQKKPTEVDMAAAAFGQRFTITPVQLATAYTAVANGGKLMQPRLVKELTDVDGKIVKTFEPAVVRHVISKETSDTLKDLLEGVVSKGTGKKAYVKGYRIAGKTGTSQTTERGVYIASFAAFAPANDPVINILVAFMNPSGDSHMGSDVAAPAAGKIIEETLNYLGIEKEYTDEDLETTKAGGN